MTPTMKSLGIDQLPREVQVALVHRFARRAQWPVNYFFSACFFICNCKSSASRRR